MAYLPTDFQDAEYSGLRKYRMINNDDGTVSFQDVTNYTKVGSKFGAEQINAVNNALNGILVDKWGPESIDNMVIDGVAYEGYTIIQGIRIKYSDTRYCIIASIFGGNNGNVWALYINSGKPIYRKVVEGVDSGWVTLGGSDITLISSSIIADCNNAEQLFLSCNGDTLNTPFKEGITSAQQGLCFTIKPGASWNTQMFLTLGETKIYMRTRTGGEWGKWVKVATTL